MDSSPGHHGPMFGFPVHVKKRPFRANVTEKVFDINTRGTVSFGGKGCILRRDETVKPQQELRLQLLALFFQPVGPFDITDVGEFPCLNGDSHLHQEGEHEEPSCPDTKGHHQLQ